MLARFDIMVGVSLIDITDEDVRFDIIDGGLYCAMREVWYSTNNLGIFVLLYVAFQSKCPELSGDNHVMNALHWSISQLEHSDTYSGCNLKHMKFSSGGKKSLLQSCSVLYLETL